jgi:hypothetical protein
MLASKSEPKIDGEEAFKKTSIYFTKNEYITRVDVTGLKYIHYLEIETNLGNIYKGGAKQPKEYQCQFDIPLGS